MAKKRDDTVRGQVEGLALERIKTGSSPEPGEGGREGDRSSAKRQKGRMRSRQHAGLDFSASPGDEVGPGEARRAGSGRAGAEWKRCGAAVAAI